MQFSLKNIFSRDLIAVALFLSMLAIIIIPLNQKDGSKGKTEIKIYKNLSKVIKK